MIIPAPQPGYSVSGSLNVSLFLILLLFFDVLILELGGPMHSFILLSDEFEPVDIQEPIRRIDLLSKWHLLYPWVTGQHGQAKTDRLAFVSD